VQTPPHVAEPLPSVQDEVHAKENLQEHQKIE